MSHREFPSVIIQATEEGFIVVTGSDVVLPASYNDDVHAYEDIAAAFGHGQRLLREKMPDSNSETTFLTRDEFSARYGEPGTLIPAKDDQ